MTPPDRIHQDPGETGHSRRSSAGVAQRLRSARLRAGWSRETLAHHSSVSWAAIAQIEAGRRKEVRPGTLMALAEALGVTVDYLVGGEPDRDLLDHRALIYDSEDEFLGATVPFLREGMERSEALIAVMPTRRIDLLRSILGVEADQVRFEDSSAWYRSPLGATVRYREFALDRLQAGSPWVGVVGEPDLGEDVGPLVTYESMFNVIFRAIPLTAFCLYDSRSTPSAVVDGLRRAHPSLVSGAQAESNPSYRDPMEHLFGERTSPWLPV